MIAVCVYLLACSNVKRCIEVLGVGEQAIRTWSIVQRAI